MKSIKFGGRGRILMTKSWLSKENKGKEYARFLSKNKRRACNKFMYSREQLSKFSNSMDCNVLRYMKYSEFDDYVSYAWKEKSKTQNLKWVPKRINIKEPIQRWVPKLSSVSNPKGPIFKWVPKNK